VIAPAILDVCDELDDHTREQRAGHEAEQQRDHRQAGSGGDEQRRDDAGDHEHDGRGGQQNGRLIDVDVEHAADHSPDVESRGHVGGA